MNSDFPRILSLLRKERGISQKSAAAQLNISQALLSHYEKGIRECGLDFLVRCANFYGVSCDYLLGLSPDRNGTTLTVDEIPEPDNRGREAVKGVNPLPVLNKKLIMNSLNIVFDLLAKSKNRWLINESSTYLMLATYKIFRMLYSADGTNQQEMFNISSQFYSGGCDAAMKIAETNASAIISGSPSGWQEKIENPEDLHVTTETIIENYPLYSSSLLNLIKNSEKRVGMIQKKP